MGRKRSERLFRINSAGRESGISVVSLIILIPTLLFLFIYFAVTLYLVLTRGTKFTQIIDEICAATARSGPMSQREAVMFFRDRINDFIDDAPIARLTLSTVDLAIVTMPGTAGTVFPFSADWNTDGSFGSCEDNFQGYTPMTPVGAGSAPAAFSSLPITGGGCNLDSGDCMYSWDMCPGGAPDPDLPVSTVINLRDVGLTVVCRATADVDALLVTRTVSAKAVHWLHDRGPSKIYDPADPLNTTAALSLIIDPHMTTDLRDSRFWFTSSGPAYDSNVISLYSPLPAPQIPPVPAVLGGMFTLGGAAHAYGGPVPPWWVLPAAVAGAGLPAAYTTGGPPLFAYPTAAGINSIIPGGAIYPVTVRMPMDRAELAVSVMNPPVLIRNIFARVFVELAARTPFRNNTEILIVNSHHQYRQPGTAIVEPNSPTLAVERGEDLMQRWYSHVASPSHGGYGGPASGWTAPPPGLLAGVPVGLGASPPTAAAAGVPATPGGPWQGMGLQGFIFPWVPPAPGVAGAANVPFSYDAATYPATAYTAAYPYSGPNEELLMRIFHRLRAFPLRLAIHVFSGAASTVRALDVWTDPGIDNTGFEPAEYTPVANAVPGMVGGTSLDYGSPWALTGLGANFCGGPGPNPGAPCLNAPELVASLGTVQGCPLQPQVLYASGGVGLNFICQKPNVGSGQPDLFGDIRAAIGSMLPGGVARLKRPGMFLPDLVATPPGAPVVPPVTVSSALTPFGQANYYPPDGVASHVVLILTKLEPDSSLEPAAIRTMVKTLNDAGRPVTVIYIPIDGPAADPFNEIPRIKNTFIDSSASGPSMNKVFIFSPYNSEYAGAYGTAANPTVDTPADFANYWRDLLDPAGTEYVVDSARDIFVHWIMGVELKF